MDLNAPQTAIATFHTVSADRRRQHRVVQEVPAPPPIEDRVELQNDDFPQDYNNDVLPFRSLIDKEVEDEMASAPRVRKYVSSVSSVYFVYIPTVFTHAHPSYAHRINR